MNHPLHRLGFVDEAVGAQLEGCDAALVVPGSGIDDHRHFTALLLQPAQYLEAIHSRHFQVEDHAVNRGAAEQFQRLTTLDRGYDLVSAQTLEIVGVLLGERGYVVDDQYQGHGLDSLAGAGRQLDYDPGARAWLSIHAEGAVEIQDEAANDRQTQAGSSRLCGIEIVEGPVQLALAHADSSIRHRDSHPVRSGAFGHLLGGQGDLAIGLSGEAIQGIPYEIFQDPPNHQRIGQSKRLLRGELGPDSGAIMADVAELPAGQWH